MIFETKTNDSIQKKTTIPISKSRNKRKFRFSLCSCVFLESRDRIPTGECTLPVFKIKRGHFHIRKRVTKPKQAALSLFCLLCTTFYKDVHQRVFPGILSGLCKMGISNSLFCFFGDNWMQFPALNFRLYFPVVLRKTTKTNKIWFSAVVWLWADVVYMFCDYSIVTCTQLHRQFCLPLMQLAIYP